MNNDLRIKIKIDSDNKELLVTKGELQKLGGVAERSSKQTGILTESLSRFAAYAGGIYTVVNAFKSLTTTGIAYNASMEKSFQTLKIIEGSPQKAAKSLEWVEEFAIKTPYAFEEVKESFIKLRAYGIDPTNGSLETLGDTAAAMGKPMMQAVEAMADAVVGENERLKEFGIRASKSGDEIKYSWTSSSGETKTAVAQNNAAIIQSTLSAIFNEKYAGAMEAQSAAWEGVTSNLTASWQKFSGSVTEDSFEGAKAGLKAMTKTMTELQNDSEFMEVFSGNMNVMSINSVNALGVMAKAFVGVSSVINTSVSGWRMTVSSFDAYFQRVGAAYDYWAARADGNAAAMEEAQARYNKIGEDWVGTISDQKNELDALISGNQKMIDGINNATSAFEKYTRKSQDVVKANNDIAASSPVKPSGGAAAPYETTNKDLQLDDKTKYLVEQYEAALARITPEADKINATYLAMYDVVKDLFSLEQMQQFYAIWGKEIDDTNDKHSAMFDQINSDIEAYGVESQDWTAGLDGVAKSIANIGNSFADIGEDLRKYQKLQNDIAKSSMSYADKQEAYSKLDKKHNEALLSGYSNAAGAAASFFDENTAGYKILTGVQIALQMAVQATALAEEMAAVQSIASSSAVASAKMNEAGANAVASVTAAGSGDPYTGIGRVIAMMALMASAFTMFGSSGSSSSGRSQGSSYISQSDSINNTSDLIIGRLDRQIDLLEAISLKGTSGQVQLDKAQSSFSTDYQLSIDSMISSMQGSLLSISGLGDTSAYDELLNFISSVNMGIGFLDVDALMNGYDAIDFINILIDQINNADVNFGGDIGTILETVIGDIQQAMTEYATSMTDIVSQMSDAADSFRDLYDNITGTTKYADIALAKAQADVDALRGDQSFASYLETQILAITSIEDAFDTSIRDLLLSTDPNDMAAQQQALYALQDATNTVFDNGVEDALNFIDSIELVGNSMIETADAIADAIGQLDDLYLGQYSPLTMLQKTDYANNVAYVMDGIGGETELEAAYMALETAAASATRDEDIRPQFDNVARLLEEQVDDATRRDIVNELVANRETMNDIVDRLDRIEASA